MASTEVTVGEFLVVGDVRATNPRRLHSNLQFADSRIFDSLRLLWVGVFASVSSPWTRCLLPTLLTSLRSRGPYRTDAKMEEGLELQ